MQPSPDHRGLGLRILSCRGHFWVHSRYGPMTRSPSPGWFCRLASSVSFPPRRQPKLRGSDSCPGGTNLPLNMPAFRWTHYGPKTPMCSHLLLANVRNVGVTWLLSSPLSDSLRD